MITNHDHIGLNPETQGLFHIKKQKNPQKTKQYNSPHKVITVIHSD